MVCRPGLHRTQQYGKFGGGAGRERRGEARTHYDVDNSGVSAYRSGNARLGERGGQGFAEVAGSRRGKEGFSFGQLVGDTGRGCFLLRARYGQQPLYELGKAL